MPATTQDHLPPRSVFNEKKWPDGYVFPACEPCNQGSSRDDALIAFMSRFNPGYEPSDGERLEWLALLRAFREHYPDAMQEMLLGAGEKRRWMQKHGLHPPSGTTYGEAPIIRIPRVVHEAVGRFNEKLAKALHYKSTGRIVPSGAWMMTRWWTNTHALTNQIPADVFKYVHVQPKLKNGSVELTRQFSYRYSVSDDGQLGMYVSVFRQIFCLLCMISFDPSQMNVDDKAIDDAIAAEADAGGPAEAIVDGPPPDAVPKGA